MRKKSTRFLSAALAACMMLSALPVGAFAAAIEQAEETGAAAGEQEEDVIPEGDIEINSKNFPSYGFRDYITENIDNNPQDGVLSREEREAVTKIELKENTYCPYFDGIEYFPNLETLKCANTQLYKADFSHNLKLKELDCSLNSLKTLDVSKNTALTKLYCYENKLTELDVSKNLELEELNCRNNQLQDLDVTSNTALTELICSSNRLTSRLDVSKNTHLVKLYCSANNLVWLDVSNNPALTELYCSSNALSGLDVSKNLELEKLNCSNNNGNHLGALNLNNNTKLTELYCAYDKLSVSELDVSKNTALTKLYCYRSNLTKLDVSNNLALEELNCWGNNLNELDVSKNTALTKLYCDENDLSELDVRNNTALTELDCRENSLTELDISQNTELTKLYCDQNKLTKLDVSQHRELQHLSCNKNQLTALNLNENAFSASYTTIYCSNNHYAIAVNENGEFDLNKLAPNGFDISKAGNWQRGTLKGTTLIVDSNGGNVTYEYNTGTSNAKGSSVIFTLDVHRHSYNGEWTYDETSHWHECSDPDCPDKEGSVKDEAPHVYTNAKDIDCNTCGYVRPMYTVTTENATVKLGDEVLNAPVAAGTEVTLTANTDPEGKTFHGWKLYKVAADGTETEITDTTGLLSGSVRVVTLTVPAYNVKAVPDYADILYDVNPVKCTVTLNNVEVPAAAKGDVITATPTEQGPGKKFTGWTVTKTVNGVEVDITDELRDVSQNGMTIAELTMPGANVTIEARFDDDSGPDLDQPVVTDDGSGNIVAGVVIGGIAAVGAYEVGTGLYRITQMDDVAMPTNRIALAKLMWERAGKPEPESTALYSDISAEDTDAQKAARWAVEQELLKDDTNEDEQKFHPAFPVSKLRVCLTWEKAKQKGLFDQNTEA